MIKVSKVLMVLSVVLAVAGPASAAGVCSSPAMSQLLAAAPGGPGALDAIVVAEPAARLVSSSVLEYDTTHADALLKGLAASAHKAGKTQASGLFTRLLKEGTPAEKLRFMSATDKPYTFPSRFTLAVKAGGVCRTVAELFCKLSCIHTGTDQEQCKEECRTIFVTSCD